MTQQGDAVAGELATEKVGIKGYLAFGNAANLLI